MLPIRALPIIEPWDCHGCAVCCRAVVRLDDTDRAKLRTQHWEQHPEYRGVRTVVRSGLLHPTYTLARRDDGSCVFLTAQGRCRIHEEHGFEAKPRVCRMFPLQPVPLDDMAIVTLRRTCPSAAAGHGRPLDEHLDAVRPLVEPRLLPTAPPPVIRGVVRDWNDARRVARVLERFVLDKRFPLVRRLVQGLQFCDLLADCRPRKLNSLSTAAFGELVQVFETEATAGAGEWFRERTAPDRAAAVLFRQAAGHYLRLHPRVKVDPSWRERWKLAGAAWRMARGRGTVPRWVPDYPDTTFAALEQPLGPLDAATLGPLDAYFETLIASWRYATLGYRGWSLVDGFRAVALSYAVALWMLRWGAEPARRADEVIAIICCLDRSHGYPPLCGWQHRGRVVTIAAGGQLQRLVAWYAR